MNTPKNTKWHIALIGYYVLIILVPFNAIIILCFFSANLVKNEAIKANKVIIEQLALSIDNQLNGFQNLSLYVQNNKAFQHILYMDKDLSPLDRYNLARFSSEFIDISLNDDFIENYLIYLPKQRLLLNSSNYRTMTTLTEDKFSKFFTRIPNYAFTLEKNYDNTILPIYKENTKDIESILFIDTMQGIIGNIDGVQFLVKLNQNFLDMITQKHELPKENSYFFLLDTTTEMPIYCNDTELPKVLIDLGYTNYSNNEFISIPDRGQYYTYRISSRVTNLDYVLLMNTSSIVTGPNIINQITLLIVLIVIILTILIFRLIHFREYNSIATTIAMLNNNSQALDDYNAFRFIKNTVSELLTDKKALEETVENSKEYLKNYFLIRLLTQQIEDRQNYTKLIEYYNISFPYIKYRVMIFYKSSDDSIKQESYNALLKKIQQEIEFHLSSSLVIESIYLDGMLVMILNYDFAFNNTEQIIDYVSQYRTILLENNIVTALSSRKDSYFELNEAYTEALETLEQCLMEGISLKAYIPQLSRNYIEHAKYYQFEDNFRNALEEGNYANAELLLNNMYGILKKAFSNNSGMIKCKLYGIINIVINIIAQGFEANFDMDIVYQLTAGKQNPDELMTGIKTVLAKFKESNPSLTSSDFSTQIENFITQHYLDMDLSVGMIADEFQVDMPTLSKRFKKERNVNISDYIHIVRIKQAKLLLTNQSLTIRDIAAQCGYLNSDVFIRVFKRYEGITPGKYRTNNK